MPNRLDYNYGLVSISSAALENSHVIIGSSTFGTPAPYDVLLLNAFNFDTSTGYMILLFDATALPANGSVTPVWWTFIGAATSTIPAFIELSWVTNPLKVTKGLVVAASSVLTTPFTLTVGTNSEVAFNVQVAA